MQDWYMLTLVGEDRPGIVARVTNALYERDINLGETSMMRLGGNFTIMMMVSNVRDEDALRELVSNVATELGLRAHVDPIQGGLHRHLVPNVQVRVNGADRVGIVAQVTSALADAGFNILDLRSDVAGSEAEPVYIMLIEGLADEPVEDLDRRVAPLRTEGVDVSVAAIETLIG